MKKILIYGVGSFKNRGVEALFNSTLAQIEHNADVVTAVFDYDDAKEKYKELKFVRHYQNKEEDFTPEEKELHDYYKSIKFDYNNFEGLYQKDVIKEMEDADLCIHIGGDNYCYGNANFLYALNIKAKELNKKTILWGASLFDEINNMELIDNLKKYDLLMIREKMSYNAIKKYIDEEKLMLVPDSAFSLKLEEVKLNKWYQKRKVIGLNLSPLTIKTEENMKSIYNFIDYILNSTDYSITLLPHVTVEDVSDMKILIPIKEKYKNEDRIFLEKDDYNCMQIKYIISKCDFLIAARTHASIAAYSTCVPTLVIGYSVKSLGIAEELFGNYKNYVLPIEEMENDSLIKKFEYIEKNKKEIRNILENKMPEIKKEASDLYSKMIDKLDKLSKKQVCPKEKCMGCSSCLNICPSKAISFKTSNEGFLYPEIDLDKCTDCGLCRKHCPVLNKQKLQSKIINCYACKAKDETLRKNSSSGGVFTYLAEKILKDKGIVYGASLENLQVTHIRVTKKDDLYKLRGSKYAQSDLKLIFSEIKKDLNDKKEVLFSGTPCQILGLKTYLGKEYDNLYSVSIICHGVTNNNILNKRIKELEKQFDSKMEDINFKSKKNGWEQVSIEYKLSRINKVYRFNEDSLMSLYSNNLILRDSCYNCSAKGIDGNLSDIILGDYWGIYNVHRQFFDNMGISAVIIKTGKGKQIFDKIKRKLDYLETDYEKIAMYNPVFENSVEKPLKRNLAFHLLDENNMRQVFDSCMIQQELKNKQELERKISDLTSENTSLRNELLQVYGSTRFKVANKVFKVADKIRGKK